MVPFALCPDLRQRPSVGLGSRPRFPRCLCACLIFITLRGATCARASCDPVRAADEHHGRQRSEIIASRKTGLDDPRAADGRAAAVSRAAACSRIDDAVAQEAPEVLEGPQTRTARKDASPEDRRRWFSGSGGSSLSTECHGADPDAGAFVRRREQEVRLWRDTREGARGVVLQAP